MSPFGWSSLFVTFSLYNCVDTVFSLFYFICWSISTRTLASESFFCFFSDFFCKTIRGRWGSFPFFFFVSGLLFKIGFFFPQKLLLVWYGVGVGWIDYSTGIIVVYTILSRSGRQSWNSSKISSFFFLPHEHNFSQPTFPSFSYEPYIPYRS